jgi:hypothetical protein
MKSPVQEMRVGLGLTKKQLADALDTNVRFVTYMEQGKIRVSDKFYIPLRKIGVDPFQLAIQQEGFIQWRREFYSCLNWGITPSNI